MTRFLNRFAILALLAAAGCDTSVAKKVQPLDGSQVAFNFPTGMTVRKPVSGSAKLLVVSSNFDLRYDQATGGTLLAVDADASSNSLPVCDSGNPGLTTCCDAGRERCDDQLEVRGSVRMGSFGGEVVYADSDNCPQLATLRAGAQARVITTSRSENSAYWMTMDDQGKLACGGQDGAACTIPLVNPNPLQKNRQLGDAYGVTVACSNGGGTASVVNGNTTLQASAFITHLTAINDQGWVTEVPLVSSGDCSSATNRECAADTPPVVPRGSDSGDLRFQDLGPSSDSYAAAFDVARSRLYVTSRVVTYGSTPLRWFDFAAPLLMPQPPLPPVPTRPVSEFNLDSVIRGSIARSLTLSHDGTRGYLAVEIYDAALAASTGSIVSASGSLLVVLDLRSDPSGAPALRVLNTVALPSSPAQVKVLPPRIGKKDLVAVTCTESGALVLYDDETGGRDPTAIMGLDGDTGKPILGKQPFGLAVESQEREGECHLDGVTRCDRLYVGSFDRGWVNVVEIDPGNPTNGWNSCVSQSRCPALVKRIGRERR